MAVTRRTVSTYFISAAAAYGAPHMASAQSADRYPTKPIRIVVPVGAGGSTDVITRLLGERVSAKLGQPIIVENRPGAGGVVGSAVVQQAAPDGYTLLMAYAAFALTPHLVRAPSYSPLAFVPITQVATQPVCIMAHPSFAPKTLVELIAWSKANPGKLQVGIVGFGSSTHVAMEQLKQSTGLQATLVPYKGSADNMNALLANEVAVTISSVSAALPFVKTGRIRVIATLTPKRVQQLPDVPTASESGVNVFSAGWTGLLGPPKMPAAIADKLQAAFAEVLREPDTIARLTDLGVSPVGNTPVEFSHDIKREFQEFKLVVEKSGMKLE